MQFEIRQYLERIYGLKVNNVRTLNVEGRKKRNKYHFFRRPDYKKVYVSFKDPATGQAPAKAGSSPQTS